MTGPREIVIFNQAEENLVSSVASILSESGRAGDADTLGNNRSALDDLARSISLYPSILEEHTLAGTSRSIDSLIRKLCTTWVPDMILHIPTKAVLGRGFSIAKINFFIMLRYVAREMERLKTFEDDILSLIAANVSALTAEEVFISIIEDMRIAEEIRYRAGYQVAQIWEYRVQYGVREFAPILHTLWKSREKLVPHFGTMLGFSELCMLSKDTETSWFDFLQRDGLTEDEICALEEFIFGLTHEEIVYLRESMEKNGKISLSRQEVESLLDKPQHYPEYWSDDPRELYRSFRDRKHHSRFRARAAAPGPKKTLEEYLMVFLLSRQQEIHSAVL
jgi:hypothetical protein